MSDDLIEITRPSDVPRTSAYVLLALVVFGGCALRLWGLGDIGLHGDEEVMSMSARAILETGSPVLPSGMYYSRALPQLYLMAGSIALFGESEWSLRLPSVLLGTLAIVVAYGLGRRFMSVYWALLFAAVIALLPDMIADSQTARMYAFYVGFVMLFAVAIFRWERTGRLGDWFVAVLAYLIALSFHSLAVFASLLFFYPLVTKPTRRVAALAGIGFAISVVSFKLVSDWISEQYLELLRVTEESAAAPLQNEIGLLEGALAGITVAAVTVIAWSLSRKRRDVADSAVVALGSGALAVALAAALLIQFHVAALAFVVGAVLYARARASILPPAVVGVACLALFVGHAAVAWQSDEVRTLNDLLERLAGYPNPLPYLTFFLMAPLATVAYLGLSLLFLVRFARGRPLPDHFVFVLLAVFAPLFLIGLFAGWYVPERYLIGFVPFFVLGGFAGVLSLPLAAGTVLRPGHAVPAVLLLVLFVSPSELRYEVNPRYDEFGQLSGHRGVDHKGAAEFVLREAGEQDIVLAVDAQQQRYYLGERLDYYIRSLNSERNSTIVRDGRMLNLYTGTPQIATGEQLAEVLTTEVNRRAYIIGSGETASNRQRYMDDGLWEAMEELGVKEVWKGRDGVTRVWRYERTSNEG